MTLHVTLDRQIMCLEWVMEAAEYMHQRHSSTCCSACCLVMHLCMLLSHKHQCNNTLCCKTRDCHHVASAAESASRCKRCNAAQGDLNTKEETQAWQSIVTRMWEIHTCRMLATLSSEFLIVKVEMLISFSKDGDAVKQLPMLKQQQTVKQNLLR